MNKFDRHFIPEDLSIPAFLRTTTAGTPCTFERQSCSDDPNTRPPGYAPSCWEEMQRDTDVTAAVELRDAVRQYEKEKFIAEKQQWAIENPELAAMERQAKRDAERRIAKLGIPPATRRSR